MRPLWKNIVSALAVAAMPFVTGLAAQSTRPDTTYFVTTQGADTVAIEWYARTGHTITGSWIQHQGGLFVHDYVLVLRDDGWPESYLMTLYTTRPHTFLLSVTYGPDSATRIMVRDSVAVTERVPTPQAYPVGAVSILGEALALERARRTHADSTTIALDRAEVRGLTPPVHVRFFGGDSVRIGETAVARVDRKGQLLGLRQGPRETRRVPSLAVASLVAGFRAADSVARAARVAIALPPAALQRFVGEYSLNPKVTFKVALDHDKLMISVGQQPPVQLLASSPTVFYVESALGVTFEFEADGTGNVTGLTLTQSGLHQRAAKTK